MHLRAKFNKLEKNKVELNMCTKKLKREVERVDVLTFMWRKMEDEDYTDGLINESLNRQRKAEEITEEKMSCITISTNIIKKSIPLSLYMSNSSAATKLHRSISSLTYSCKEVSLRYGVSHLQTNPTHVRLSLRHVLAAFGSSDPPATSPPELPSRPTPETSSFPPEVPATRTAPDIETAPPPEVVIPNPPPAPPSQIPPRPNPGPEFPGPPIPSPSIPDIPIPKPPDVVPPQPPDQIPPRPPSIDPPPSMPPDIIPPTGPFAVSLQLVGEP
ncbi:PREDICTED: formin-1-like [Nelumbo nucifera]|uniref:Formin-1-like n=1 Tax=Nelumbo nucifera TaxID=4432 RepID=A0A1U8B4I8_NELNU|nr:PREDICTED: formin-1-like [Nelumbo nucifera]